MGLTRQKSIVCHNETVHFLRSYALSHLINILTILQIKFVCLFVFKIEEASCFLMFPMFVLQTKL